MIGGQEGEKPNIGRKAFNRRRFLAITGLTAAGVVLNPNRTRAEGTPTPSVTPTPNVKGIETRIAGAKATGTALIKEEELRQIEEQNKRLQRGEKSTSTPSPDIQVKIKQAVADQLTAIAADEKRVQDRVKATQTRAAGLSGQATRIAAVDSTATAEALASATRTPTRTPTPTENSSERARSTPASSPSGNIIGTAANEAREIPAEAAIGGAVLLVAIANVFKPVRSIEGKIINVARRLIGRLRGGAGPVGGPPPAGGGGIVPTS